MQASIEAEIASEQAIEGAARWLPKIKHEIKLLDDIEAGAREATPDYVNGIKNNIEGLKAELADAKARGAEKANVIVEYDGGEVLDIDNISNGGKTWTEVKSKNSFGLKSSSWTIEVLPKAQNMLIAAKEKGVTDLRFSFPKGVSPEVAAALESMGFTVEGQRISTQGK